MPELAEKTPEQFCCTTMMLAMSFDGPFFRYIVHGPQVAGVTVYKLTPSGKRISNAIGNQKNLTVNFCPFCGKSMEWKE